MNRSANETAMHLQLEEFTPNGPFSCADLFAAELNHSPWLLLLDGTFESPHLDTAPPRLRLAQALRAAWPAMRNESPAAALRHLSSTLRATNTEGSQSALFCSGAMCRLMDNTWEIAECGDTRVFTREALGAPCLAGGQPFRPEVHRLTAPLGSPEPSIVTRRATVSSGGAIALLTDGAWRILSQEGGLDSAAGRLTDNALELFTARRYRADDDATFAWLTNL